MSLSLFFFLLSLLGIVLMIGRKLVLVRSGKYGSLNGEEIDILLFVTPNLEKIKLLTFRNVKRLGYFTVFATLRLMIKSSNFVKVKSRLLVGAIKNRLKKDKDELIEEIVEKKEVSKYLRVISEYRQKIKRMKHIIKEREGIE